MNFQQPSISARVMPVKMGKEKPMMGGKWEVVKEFSGKSHRDGGIDIVVQGGQVHHINSPSEKPDVIAKNGRVWKSIGAGLYGAGEGLLDTITMGATDQLTDLGYSALQKAGGSSADEIREQNSVRGYGAAAGAITGGILSGGSATGSAIQQGAKGVGAGVGQGSPDSKVAQAVGTYLPLAGNVAGMAVGNAGYGDAIKGATAAGDAAKAAGDTAKAADYAAKAAKLTKFSNMATTAGKIDKFAPLIQGAASALSATGKQQPLNLGPVQQGIRDVTPFVSPSMMRSYGQLGREMRGEGGPMNQTGASSMDRGGAAPTPFFSDGGGEGGPIMFRQQPLSQEAAFNYLSRYGINT
jgi:hypothetical protein